VTRAGQGCLAAVVLGLLSIADGGAEARAQPPSGRAVRHRHRAGLEVAHHRVVKRSHARGRRHAARAQPAAQAPTDVAFVTLTTPAQGTSFYVDSRRVGTGSTVRQSLPPGYHQVQAVHPSGARWQKYLSFEAGQDRKLIVYW
jgi:hypothetical protein